MSGGVLDPTDPSHRSDIEANIQASVELHKTK